MEKKYIILALICYLFTNINAQFVDDMETYVDGLTIYTGHWTDWNQNGNTPIYSSSTHANSGQLSGYIPANGTTDGVLDLGNKSTGDWGIKFMMYIPSGKSGYFNLQEHIPTNGVSAVGDIYFNKDGNYPGSGYVSHLSTGTYRQYFNFPHDQWFEIIINFSFGLNNQWEFIVNGNSVTNGFDNYFRLTGAGQLQESLAIGCIDFFSRTANTTEFWIDDFNFINGHHVLSLDNTGDTTATACGSFMWYGDTYTSSSTPTHTFTNVAGGDSVVTLDLTIYNSASSIQHVNSCEPYTWIDGNVYSNSTATPTYTFFGGSQNGCDSTVNLDLTVYVLPITTIDYINGDLVSSSSVDYQWFLDNNELIGANGQSLTPQDNGCYTVVVSDNNCTDTSACYNITNVSFSEYSELKYSISPNPSEGIFYFSSEDFDLNKGIVMDLSGRLLFSIQKNTKIIDMSTLPAGIYILQFETEGVKYQKRLVKQ